MATRDTLLAQVLHLPIDERAALVRQAAASLDPDSDPDAAESWALEIGDRIRALRRGELKTTPATEVFAIR
jgi:putative addiction module component (TIGR02574 family)